MSSIDTNHAVITLQQFAKFATLVENITNGRELPHLKLFSDGSGCVIDDVSDIVYIKGFSNFEDLAAQLALKLTPMEEAPQ